MTDELERSGQASLQAIMDLMEKTNLMLGKLEPALSIARLNPMPLRGAEGLRQIIEVTRASDEVSRLLEPSRALRELIAPLNGKSLPRIGNIDVLQSIRIAPVSNLGVSALGWLDTSAIEALLRGASFAPAYTSLKLTRLNDQAALVANAVAGLSNSKLWDLFHSNVALFDSVLNQGEAMGEALEKGKEAAVDDLSTLDAAALDDEIIESLSEGLPLSTFSSVALARLQEVLVLIVWVKAWVEMMNEIRQGILMLVDLVRGTQSPGEIRKAVEELPDHFREYVQDLRVIAQEHKPLRVQPEAQAEVCGRLSVGSVVEVLAKKDQWLQVITVEAEPELTGWTHRKGVIATPKPRYRGF